MSKKIFWGNLGIALVSVYLMLSLIVWLPPEYEVPAWAQAALLALASVTLSVFAVGIFQLYMRRRSNQTPANGGTICCWEIFSDADLAVARCSREAPLPSVERWQPPALCRQRLIVREGRDYLFRGSMRLVNLLRGQYGGRKDGRIWHLAVNQTRPELSPSPDEIIGLIRKNHVH